MNGEIRLKIKAFNSFDEARRQKCCIRNSIPLFFRLALHRRDFFSRPGHFQKYSCRFEVQFGKSCMDLCNTLPHQAGIVPRNCSKLNLQKEQAAAGPAAESAGHEKKFSAGNSGK